MRMNRSRRAHVGLAVLVVSPLIGMFGYAQSPPRPNAQGEQPRIIGGLPAGRYPKVNTAIGYRFVEGWPHKAAGVAWGAMPGIAVDASDNIWTFNRGKIPVQVYRPDGQFVKMWGEGMFKNPHAIRFDNDGNVWVCDNIAQTVMKLTPHGKFLMTLGVNGEAGDDDRHFNQPTDVAVTPAGVFISDGYGNNRIVHYDKNGKFVKTWGRLGSKLGELSLPHGIAADSKGCLYVLERNNARVQVFEPSGQYVDEWRNIITPWAITITPRDEIYVVGSTAMQWWEIGNDPIQMNGVPPRDQVVVRFDTTGRVQQIWSFPKGAEGKEHKPGELTWVHGIAVTSNGDLYLGDITGRSAQKFARIAPQRLSTTSRRQY